MDLRSALRMDGGKMFTEPYVQRVFREGYVPDREVEAWVNQSVKCFILGPPNHLSCCVGEI